MSIGMPSISEGGSNRDSVMSTMSTMSARSSYMGEVPKEEDILEDMFEDLLVYARWLDMTSV
jgi:predicted RNase H-like nuclease